MRLTAFLAARQDVVSHRASGNVQGSRAFERPYRPRQASWWLVQHGRARNMSDDTVSWFAAVDWGSEQHQACILDAVGKVIGERAFPHGGAGLAALCDWLVSGGGGPGKGGGGGGG